MANLYALLVSQADFHISQVQMNAQIVSQAVCSPRLCKHPATSALLANIQ
jgi:hypothetical protein